jgi:hypothetical protein
LTLERRLTARARAAETVHPEGSGSIALADADDDRTARVRDYERTHKNRAGVLSAAERELATA